jgi:hypothetical protein
VTMNLNRVFQYPDGLLRQHHLMRPCSVLNQRCRYGQGSTLRIVPIPLCFGYFTAPLSSKHKQLNSAPERVSNLLTSLPNRLQLCISQRPRIILLDLPRRQVDSRCLALS